MSFEMLLCNSISSVDVIESPSDLDGADDDDSAVVVDSFSDS